MICDKLHPMVNSDSVDNIEVRGSDDEHYIIRVIDDVEIIIRPHRVHSGIDGGILSRLGHRNDLAARAK